MLGMKRRDFVLVVIDAASEVEIGRTALQKTCYFVGELQGRTDLEYRAYYYGPFSAARQVSALQVFNACRREAKLAGGEEALYQFLSS